MTPSLTISEQFKAGSEKLFEGDSESKLKAATIYKYVAEAERQLLEVATLRRTASTEQARFIFTLLAPLLSALAVVGALVFQTIQFRENTILQRQTMEIQRQTVDVQSRSAEDTQWREAIKTFTQAPSAINGIAGTSMLLAFLKQGNHKDEARTMATGLLGDMQHSFLFSTLFAATMEAAPNADRFDGAIAISTRLQKAWKVMYTLASEIRPIPDSEMPILKVNGKDSPNPSFARAQVEEELALVCKFIAQLIKGDRPEKLTYSLANATLWSCDLSASKLRGANLVNLNIQTASLTNADLSEVTEFSGSNWSNTAWWHAKSISKSLIEYLLKYYPFNEKASYYQVESREVYDKEVNRLRGLN